nr:MAG TPA: hypothetical protein [Caudoviricetes sp.]
MSLLFIVFAPSSVAALLGAFLFLHIAHDVLNHGVTAIHTYVNLFAIATFILHDNAFRILKALPAVSQPYNINTVSSHLQHLAQFIADCLLILHHFSPPYLLRFLSRHLARLVVSRGQHSLSSQHTGRPLHQCQRYSFFSHREQILYFFSAMAICRRC